MKSLSHGRGGEALMEPHWAQRGNTSLTERLISDSSLGRAEFSGSSASQRRPWNTAFILGVCITFGVAAFFVAAGSVLLPYINLPGQLAPRAPGALGARREFPQGQGKKLQNPSGAGPAPAGVTVAAACKNRHAALRRALPSWLRLAGVREIVIVDWSSQPPLRAIVSAAAKQYSSKTSPNIRLIRVENEKHWVLSRAYNLALKKATQGVLLKLDCDYVTSAGMLRAHSIRPGSPFYYTGDYTNSRNENEVHLNGIMLVGRAQFAAVGGYDERIQTYGVEDEELYSRLDARELVRRNVSYEHVSHVQHKDAERVQAGVMFPRVSIDFNKLLMPFVKPKWSRTMRSSEYAQFGGNPAVLEARYIPRSIQKLVNESVRKEKWRVALGARLNQGFDVPWTYIAAMKTPSLEKLLRNLNSRAERQQAKAGDTEIGAPRIIFVHVQNGLGNRLRALGSALNFAEKTDREVVVIWEADAHLGGLFSDIFDSFKAKQVVMSNLGFKGSYEELKKWDPALHKFDFYNYMGDQKETKILNNISNHIYFNSSFVMNSAFTSWESENKLLRQIPINPDVLEIVERHGPSQFANVGGAHIRNRSLATDIANVDPTEYGPDAATIDMWRSKTSYRAFVPEMKKLLEAGNVTKFFVATDDVSVLAKVQRFVGKEQILSIPRSCDDRGAKCIKYAMADILVLARTKLFLGSTWSSFTEAAMRFGAPKARLAGSDFGNISK